MNNCRPQFRIGLALAAFLAVGAAVGCEKQRFVPEMATRPYPRELHTTNVVDIQVFRDGSNIELVNSTAHEYHDFDLWINQRYMRNVELLAAGDRLILSLWDFYDMRGERMNAGGLFRTTEPTPVRMVEIQPGEDTAMIGLIAIPEVEIMRYE